MNQFQLRKEHFLWYDDYVDFWQLSIITDVHYNLDWYLIPIISCYFGLKKKKFSWNEFTCLTTPFSVSLIKDLLLTYLYVF